MSSTLPSSSREAFLFDHFKGAGKYALFGAVAFGLVALIPVFLGGLLSERSFEARRAIEFSFPGVEEQRYPSGIPFAIQDVTVPVVLERAYRRLGLDQYDVAYRDFRDAVSIEPYAPTYEERANAYRTRLTVENLEGPDIELIEGQMREGLASLYGKTALLQISLSGRGNIPEGLLSQIPSVILEEWSAYSIDNRGVVNLPAGTGVQTVVAVDRITNFSFPLVDDYFASAAEKIEGQLADLVKLPGFAALTDSVHGRTAGDVVRALADLTAFQQKPLILELEARGVVADWMQSAILLEEEKDRIGRQVTRYKSRARDLAQLTSDYVSIDEDLRPTRGGIVRAEGQSAAGTSSGDYIALGDGFAERIFDIAETSSRHAFVQDVLRQKQEALDSVSELEARLARINRFERVAKGSGFQTYTTHDRERLTQLGSDFNALWVSVRALSDQAQAQRQHASGHLYNLIGEKKPTEIRRPLWNSMNIILLLLGIIVGGLCGVAVGVLRQIQRSLKE